MKFKLTLVLVLLVFSISIFAKEVNLDKAKEAAECFIRASSESNLKSSSVIDLTYFKFETTHPFQSSLKSSGTENELIYIFNLNQDDGFIVVSGDDQARPILRYSFEGSFSEKNIPGNLAKWLEGYKNQIRYIQSNDNSGQDKPNDLWEALLSGNYYSTLKSTMAVDPLVTTEWNQSPFVNEFCPYDSDAGENAVTGCAATAMAQIMKFWNYPETGAGFHSYNHDEYGTLSANFGSTTYDWSSMTDVVNSMKADP